MKKLIALVLVLLLAFYVGWPVFSSYRIHKALAADDSATLAQMIDFPSVRRSMRGPVLAKIESRIAGVMKTMGPAAAMLGGQIKQDKIEGVIDGALEDVVNPKRIGGIYAKGGDFAGAIKQSVMRQIEKMGGFAALMGGGEKSAGSGDSGGASFGGIKLPGGLGAILGGKQAGGIVGQLAGKAFSPDKIGKMLFPKRKKNSGGDGGGDAESSFGFSNIKNFGFAGPLGLQLGIAKDSSADAPDVTAQYSFTGFDWRLTKLTPNLDRF